MVEGSWLLVHFRAGNASGLVHYQMVDIDNRKLMRALDDYDMHQGFPEAGQFELVLEAARKWLYQSVSSPRKIWYCAEMKRALNNGSCLHTRNLDCKVYKLVEP